MKRIVGYLLLLATITIAFYLSFEQEKPEKTALNLRTPSPLLGQTIANALHQAMSDPYLVAFERAMEFLSSNSDATYIELSRFADWAPDSQFPTFFTFNSQTGNFSFDKPTSAWAADGVKSELYRKSYTTKLGQPIRIVILDIQGQRWWMAAIVVSDGSQAEPEVIGAFFNIDNYLKEHIPRFIDNVVQRKRFPLIPFQTSSLSGNLSKGQISIRILDNKKRVYLQRGNNFEPDLLIYAESKWYDNTVVCLNTGWDLQIFSTVPMIIVEKEPNLSRNRLILMITILGIISLVYWWSTTEIGKIRQPTKYE